ncbi:MAG: hypothetical protein F6K08_18005, partial [Okeania sp. SIO1H6]|nr:hypothetical protein [Okeania sp. SIO1H6]
MKFLNINRKTISFFLSVLISIFCLGGTLGCLPAYAALNCGDDSTTLDCWNDTPTKQAITDFVDQVITGTPVIT